VVKSSARFVQMRRATPVAQMRGTAASGLRRTGAAG